MIMRRYKIVSQVVVVVLRVLIICGTSQSAYEPLNLENGSPVNSDNFNA